MDLTTIEHELQKFNVTDAAIADLKQKYMPLTVNGFADKEGLKAVSDARKKVKGLRIDVENKRKEMTAGALDYQRKIMAEARRITNLLEPIECHLALEEKKVTDEIERIKREKQEAEELRYQQRTQRLYALDFRIEPGKLITDYLDTFNNERIYIHLLHLRQWEDALFEKFYENAKDYHQIHMAWVTAEAKRVQEEKEAAEALHKAEAERLEQQRKEQEAERQRLEAIAREHEAKEAALKRERELLDAQQRHGEEQILKEEREKQRIHDDEELKRIQANGNIEFNKVLDAMADEEKDAIGADALDEIIIISTAMISINNLCQRSNSRLLVEALEDALSQLSRAKIICRTLLGKDTCQ